MLFNPIRSKLSGPHVPLKHQIQLPIRPPLRLRHSSPTPNRAQRRQAAEKEPQFASQISLVRIDHIRDGDRHGDANGGLDGGGEGNGFAADASSADFAEDDEGDGADGEVVKEVPDDLDR
jgi:hypothetical protein